MRPPSARVQDFEALARRRSVAAWIENLTGVPLPTAHDYSFRSALSDGVLLCRVMNKLAPYSITKVSEECGDEQGFIENIDNFLMSAEKYGMPNETLFTPEDITEGLWEDRPRVAECLYQLERFAEQMGYQDQSPLAADRPYSSYGSGGSVTAGSPDPYQQLAMMAGGPESLRNLAESVPGMDGALGSGSKAKGISKLMEQCNSLLKDRMYGEGITSPTSGRGTASPHACQKPHAPTTPAGEGGALRSLEGMLKQVLEGITTAQERQGRSEVEQMEKYTRSLEQQIELLQNQQPVYDPGYVPEEVEMIQKTAEDLSLKLEEYEMRLEQEHKEKTRLQMQLEELRGKVDSVANIHEKYAQIQEENRKLYNLVQDLRGNIRVFCRVRPMGITGDDTECCVDIGEEGEVAISNKGSNDKRKMFKFDKVFGWNSLQDQVYSETQPLIRSVLDGYNVCIFAYGQTGSGKTHTMSGTDVQEYKGRGINYRALDDLFQIKRDRADEVHYDIHVQMLEIYNEVLRDLLTTDATKKNRLDIMSTEKSGENVPDATQMDVTCTDDVLRFMAIGAKNRAVGSTKMNQRSSRSHSVLTVVVDGDNSVTGVKSHGCLHLVDLAGSERLSRSEATGDRLEEAKHINKSLSALGDVMSALAQKSNHVPYRNSKLTQLLQDSLSGQAKAMMFMHIAPESASRGETCSTLMFGARVSQITLGQAKKNTESSKIYEAREAMDKLNSKAEKRQERIEELERVVETERAMARSAMSEKEAMERELAQLRAELKMTKRSMQNGNDVSSGGLGTARRRGAASHDAEPPTPGRRVSRPRSGFGSETSGRTSLRTPKDVVKPLPSLSQRSNSSRDSGPASARQRRTSSAANGRTPRTTPRSTPRNTPFTPRSTPRNTPFTPRNTPRNTPFVPSTGDKPARRTGPDSSRENSFMSGRSKLESSGSMLRRAQAEKVRNPARAVTSRENMKPRASGTSNPRRATATLKRDTSNMSTASGKSSTRASSGSWRARGG